MNNKFIINSASLAEEYKIKYFSIDMKYMDWRPTFNSYL